MAAPTCVVFTARLALDSGWIRIPAAVTPLPFARRKQTRLGDPILCLDTNYLYGGAI
jgi:hypothetical protein